MKRLLSVLFALCFVLLTSCATSPPMELASVTAISRENGAEVMRFTEYAYDTEGKLIRETYLDSQKKKIYDLLYSYDEYGRRVSAEAIKGDEATVVYQGSIAWEYDESGRVSAIISKTGKVMEYTYDEAGRVIRRAACGVNSRDSHYKWEEYEFLGDGVIRKEGWCDGWEEPSVTVCRETCDEEGRVTLREYTREEEQAAFRIHTFEYDENGRIVRVETSSRSDASSELIPKNECIFTYDEEGRLLNYLERDLETSEVQSEKRYEYREIAPNADFSPSHFEKQQEEILENLLDFKLKFF